MGNYDNDGQLIYSYIILNPRILLFLPMDTIDISYQSYLNNLLILLNLFCPKTIVRRSARVNINNYRTYC